MNHPTQEKVSCGSDAPVEQSELEKLSSGMLHATDRLQSAIHKLRNRNDRLFGGLPETTNEKGQELETSCAIPELHRQLGVIHNLCNELDCQNDRQDTLI